MNFKPTSWKGIVSIVAGLVFHIFMFRYKKLGTIQPTWDYNLFGWDRILTTIIIILVIYITWSLLQKK